MGLIKAITGAAGGVLGDQWKEYFYCEAMPADVLVEKGCKKVKGRFSNRTEADNIISNGSVIAVNEGQCMLIVEQGKVVDFCALPGEYTYDISTEPSLFSGDLEDTIQEVFANIGKRFTFGGLAPKDQRVYFINTKELVGNKYGTPNPVPFRVVDSNVVWILIFLYVVLENTVIAFVIRCCFIQMCAETWSRILQEKSLMPS